MKINEILMMPADGDTAPAGGTTPPAVTTAPSAPPATQSVAPTQPSPESGPATDKLPPPGLSDEAMAGLLDDSVSGEPGDVPQKASVPTPPVAPTTPAAPSVSPQTKPPVVPPATPQVPPVAAPQTPAAPVTPPAAAPAQPPTTPPQPPVAPQQSPQEIQAAQAARRQEYVTQVEKGYSFDEKTALEVNANPAAILPKLAAKMHVDMLESAIHGIMMQLPQVVEGYMTQRETTRRNEDEFYKSWPMIDRANPEHRSTVNGILSAIVQRNPSISRAEAMKQAGAATLVALGIPYTLPQSAPETPTVPGQPQVAPRASDLAVPPVGFSPALPGAGGQGLPGRAIEENPFSKMSREFEEDI